MKTPTIPDVPFHMICHMSRSKSVGGHAHIYRNEELAISVWRDLNGVKFYLDEVGDSRAKEKPLVLPTEPSDFFDSAEALFSDHPSLLERAEQLYGNNKE